MNWLIAAVLFVDLSKHDASAAIRDGLASCNERGRCVCVFAGTSERPRLYCFQRCEAEPICEPPELEIPLDASPP